MSQIAPYIDPYYVSESVMISTCVVLSTVSIIAPSMLADATIEHLQQTFEKIDGKLDIMLKTPLNKAIDNFKFTLESVLSENYETAYETLDKLKDNAHTAFHYAGVKNTIETYREIAKALRFLIFATILRESYDKERRAFLSLDRLSFKKIKLIGMATERMVEASMIQKKKVKLSTRFGFNNASISLELEDIQNSIRKAAYPYISRAKKLNDMNKPLQLFQSSSETPPCFLTFSLLPELLPIGKENKTELYLGIKTDSDGKSSAIKVKVWREKNNVNCECEHQKRRRKILSDTEKIFMTLSCCYQPTVKIAPTNTFFQFSLLPELMPGDKAQLKLCVGEKMNSEVKLNVWREGNTVMCEHRKYKGYKSRADIKSECEDVVMKLPPCPGPLTLSATGQTGGWSHFLGDYTITGEKHGDRPVYTVGACGYMWSTEDNKWAVGLSVDHSTPRLKSNNAAPCPALCHDWQYWDLVYKPGEISVKCTIHN